MSEKQQPFSLSEDDPEATVKRQAYKPLPLPPPDQQNGNGNGNGLKNGHNGHASADLQPLKVGEMLVVQGDGGQLQGIAPTDEVERREALSEAPTDVLPAAPHPAGVREQELQPDEVVVPPLDEKELELREEFGEEPTRFLPATPRPIPLGQRSIFYYLLLVYLITPLRQLQRLWRFSHILFIIIMLIPIVGASAAEYLQLSHTQTNLYQLDALSGATQWQDSVTTPLQTSLVDARGSLLNLTVSGNQHQLVALDPNGVTQWKTVASTDSYSFPIISSQPDAILVAASKSAFSTNTPYFQSLTLSLLNRTTGQPVWQDDVINPGQPQAAAILGADSNFIYVAIVQTPSSASKTKPSAQLLAIAQATGAVSWRVQGPSVSDNQQFDAGQVLAIGSQTIWQVAGIVYALETVSGKVDWKHPLYEDDSSTLSQEEMQMATTNNLLLVGRRDFYHALNLATGNEEWALPSPGTSADSSQNQAGLAIANNTLLLYGDGNVEAFDITNQHLIWSQKQLDGILGLHLSDDKTQVYIALVDSIEGSGPAQSLVDLDMSDGAARWTFQPSDQMTLLPIHSNVMIYTPTVLFASICLSSSQTPCLQPYLYALNPVTGDTFWKVQGNSISDILISTDGKTLILQRNTSAWLDLVNSFRN